MAERQRIDGEGGLFELLTVVLVGLGLCFGF
jgi:hypothetical protein